MDADEAARPVARRPGGRSARVRAAVLAAAVDELTEHGFGGMSSARIAERAGVNRTTVHRRWPHLEDLVEEALLDRAAVAVPIPDTGTVRGDLRLLLHEIAEYVDSDARRGTIRALVADSARSPVIGAVVSRVWTSRFGRGTEVVARAVARGELRADIAPATILAAFTGPLYVRLLITDERIDDSVIEAVLDVGLDGARRSAAAAASPGAGRSTA
ncbi:MAG: TetR/AcrR family transcriptional regulator [Pseudonocardia sp.]|nr:TetR/AcrR family transcriptional regulator [Pseudonocardia sp.]